MNKILIEEIKEKIRNRDVRYYHNLDTMNTSYQDVVKTIIKNYENFKKDCAKAFGISESSFNELCCMYMDMNPKRDVKDSRLRKIEFIENLHRHLTSNNR